MTSNDPDLRTSARVVLALGVLVGLVLAVMTVATSPTQFGIASSVYYYAGQATLAGENVYDVAPPESPNYHYLYPPIVVVAFLPHAFLGSESAALALQTVLNLTAASGLAVVLVRALERRGVPLERIDRVLVFAFVVLSAHALPQIIQGQVTLWLALALAIGFDALETGHQRLAGVAFALAALVKLFPTVVGLWLLRRRAWGAVAAATATGVGGILLGLLVFGPDLTVQYFFEVLPDRFDDQTFEGTPDPERTHVTVRRQLGALVTTNPALLTPLSALVLAPFVAACYRRIDTDERRLAAILATLLAMLLFFPFQPLYFSLLAFPLIILLYRLAPGRPRQLLLAGTLLTYTMVGFETVDLAVAVLPLSPGLESALLAAGEAVFTVVLPPTLGMWLLLLACVLVCSGDLVPGTESESEPELARESTPDAAPETESATASVD